MRGTAVARRYARALFNIGYSDGLTEEYGSALQQTAELFKSNPRIPEVLDSPLYDKQFREEVLEKIVSSFEDKLQAYKNFLLLLYDKRRLGVLQNIADSYQELADRQAGRLSADVSSAKPLDGNTQSRIAKALSKRLGKDVSIRVSVDPSLVAGFRAQVGSVVIDGSVSGELNRLKETLKQGTS